MSKNALRKPLNDIEVAAIAQEAQFLVGSRLQEVKSGANALSLELYQSGEGTFVLGFDINPATPFLWKEKGGDHKNLQQLKDTPMRQFLRAHLKGKKLLKIEKDPLMGRVLQLYFEGEARLEFRLIPGHTNLLAILSEHRMSWAKPKDLPISRPGVSPKPHEPQSRTWPEALQEWKTPLPAAEVKPPKTLEKKKKALEKMRTDLQVKLNTPWQALGEYIKSHLHLEDEQLYSQASDNLLPLFKKGEPLKKQMSIAFSKSKDVVRKIAEAEIRISKLEQEIANLEAGNEQSTRLTTQAPNRTSDQKKSQSLMAVAEARGRSHALAPDLSVFVGRSGSDNLRLLRKARPEDLWLHLKDQPGAYGIMRRSGKRPISNDELNRAMLWVTEQTLKKTARELAGQVFEVLVVECRHVRPIKGDKLGRVTFHNERVVRLKV